MKKKVSIIICSYNEEACLPIIIAAIHKQMKAIEYFYEIIIVDDGSTDRSLELLKEMTGRDPSLFYVEFSRNFGHQSALKAGLDLATGDCLISMDADMQHPPHLIPKLIEKWEEGYDIVYTRRKEDKNLPLFKRKTSKLFYKILNLLSDMKLDTGASDFRLLDRNSANVITQFKEYDLFIRGLVKWVGFKQIALDFFPDQRTNGTTKYTLRKMTALAVHGITSFSVKPLYLALYLGFFFASLSLLYIPYVIYSLVFDHVISGWSSLIVTVAFFGGLQLSILGIIGIYIGKIFMQTKQRPNYIVKSTNLPH